MIAVVDYGAGNLRSVVQALVLQGFDCKVTKKSSDLEDCAGIILPGVGSFAAAAESLKRSGLIEALVSQVENKPLLGICLGMQLLVKESEEAFGKDVQGLDIIPGRCLGFKASVRVPHMGWNQVSIDQESPLFAGIPSGSWFYFAHSFYVKPKQGRHILAKTAYGGEFASAVFCRNIYGVQFHPEKSGAAGLKLLRNFAELISGERGHQIAGNTGN